MTFVAQSGSIRRPTVVQICGRPSAKPSPFWATSGWTSISPKDHELLYSYPVGVKELVVLGRNRSPAGGRPEWARFRGWSAADLDNRRSSDRAALRNESHLQ